MDAPVVIEVVTNESIFHAEQAEAIRVLGKRAVRDIIEIGARLTMVKEGDSDRGIKPIGHGNWLPWLDREFGWNIKTAERFISVYGMSKTKIDNLSNLEIGVSALYMLAAPSTPAEVQAVVIEKVERGEHLTTKQIKEMIADVTKKQKEEMTDKLKAQRDADLEKAEGRIARLQEQFDAREKKIRKEYDGLLSLEEVEAQIEKSIAPLKKKLERAEELAERLKKPPPKKADKRGIESVGVAYALGHFVESCLKVTPENVIEHQRFVTEATGQTMKAGLSDKIANAKRAVAWLEKFIEATSGI
jgi:hypothetical protein